MSRFYQQQRLAFARVRNTLNAVAKQGGGSVSIPSLLVDIRCEYEVSRKALLQFIQDFAKRPGFSLYDDELVIDTGGGGDGN